MDYAHLIEYIIERNGWLSNAMYFVLFYLFIILFCRESFGVLNSTFSDVSKNKCRTQLEKMQKEADFRLSVSKGYTDIVSIIRKDNAFDKIIKAPEE